MHGILTTPTPERAVYAAAKLSRYRDYLFGLQSGASLK
jgi:hypothetical protein